MIDHPWMRLFAWTSLVISVAVVVDPKDAGELSLIAFIPLVITAWALIGTRGYTRLEQAGWLTQLIAYLATVPSAIFLGLFVLIIAACIAAYRQDHS